MWVEIMESIKDKGFFALSAYVLLAQEAFMLGSPLRTGRFERPENTRSGQPNHNKND
jgi:hypothetical protein